MGRLKPFPADRKSCGDCEYRAERKCHEPGSIYAVGCKHPKAKGFRERVTAAHLVRHFDSLCGVEAKWFKRVATITKQQE
jgi:hypothetical protein